MPVEPRDGDEAAVSLDGPLDAEARQERRRHPDRLGGDPAGRAATHVGSRGPHDRDHPEQLPVHLPHPRHVAVEPGDGARTRGPDEARVRRQHLGRDERRPPLQPDRAAHPDPRRARERSARSDRRAEHRPGGLGETLELALGERAPRRHEQFLLELPQPGAGRRCGALPAHQLDCTDQAERWQAARSPSAGPAPRNVTRRGVGAGLVPPEAAPASGHRPVAGRTSPAPTAIVAADPGRRDPAERQARPQRRAVRPGRAPCDSPAAGASSRTARPCAAGCSPGSPRRTRPHG